CAIRGDYDYDDYFDYW
nr:immunoglobulin heavy chain junction region [Mus musculus]MBK4185043.1 immunoglobulin heavy chain junction region [Mus musculus]